MFVPNLQPLKLFLHDFCGFCVARGSLLGLPQFVAEALLRAAATPSGAGVGRRGSCVRCEIVQVRVHVLEQLIGKERLLHDFHIGNQILSKGRGGLRGYVA